MYHLKAAFARYSGHNNKLARLLAVCIAAIVITACAKVDSNHESFVKQPLRLAINQGFVNPIGFYDATPTFSWQLNSDGESKSQTHYQIVVASSPESLPDNPDLWDSQAIESEQSTFVEYKGAPLTSRQQVFWQVRYWNEHNKVSDWSDVAQLELGLLDNSDWQAKWIEINSTDEIAFNKFKTPIHVPQYLRSEFSTNSSIKQARLYITAKGVFEAFINGKRVGDDILTPGYTPYKKRIETLTYDVTEHLISGKNAFAIALAEGWYAGRFGPKRHWHKKLELTPKVMAQLEIEYADGTKQIVNTDDQWQATQQGPIRTSGLYDGERYDANYELVDKSGSWDQVGYNASEWLGVKTTEIDKNTLLQPKRHFTSKNKQVLPALSVNQVNGKTIFDLGQNMVGVPKIKVPMLKGQTLNLRFAEGINADGSLYTKNLGSAKQLDYYTANKDGFIEWQPTFTFHGFRYVELSGFDANFEPELSWVEGVVQYTDFELAGEFATSNPQLNQLQSNIEWGLKGNFLDIPTDCPQRSERLGWTGDALAFAPTSLFIADSHAFWAAWMQSIREEQFENHGIPVVVPNEVGEIVQSGWSDAGVTIPWDVYWRTGDVEILAENYELMTRWILYHQSELEENGISKMWTVGDWLQPYSKRKDSRRGETDHKLISTAFYARSLDFVARTAKVLGKQQDAKLYQQLFDQIKAKFQQHFFDADGRLQVGEQTQTAYLLAIGFDLLDEKTTEKAVPHMLEQFEVAGGHLRTGFLGTPLIAPVLDKVGRADVAFDLVFKQTYPSWLFSVSQGATTMWERWDGFTHEHGYVKKAGSLNHYAYGAIGQWLYDRLAGISPLTAGYKTIRIAPLITEHLAFAEASYESPYGLISSKWQKQTDKLIMNIVIPPNTRAQVEIPKQVIAANINNAKQVIGGKVVINGEQISQDGFEWQSKATAAINLKPGSYEIVVAN